MNLSLLDPFRNSFPEVIEETLEEGYALTCAFNRKGTLLATGCWDGRVVIWDFDTRGVVTILNGHSQTVTSVSWSKNGRKLLSSSADWTVNLYDVLTGNVDRKIQFEGPVYSAQMHPRNNDLCLVCPHLETPVLVELQTGTKRVIPSQSEEDEKQEAKKATKDIWSTGTVAVFNKTGSRIYSGNTKGIITVIDTDSFTILFSFKIPGGSSIRSINFSRSGRQYLLNSTDRVIRLFEGEDSKTSSREFIEPINKMQWKKCCFSSDAEYIIGASAQKSNHNIYIWNRDEGGLLKSLEGPKEGIHDLVWHPTRPVIVSIGSSGVCFIWASNYTENWSAFAPDFKELEENEEYIEREDEFDYVEEGSKNKSKMEITDELVDILTNDDVSNWSSDSDSDLLFIPITITPDPKIEPVPTSVPQDAAPAQQEIKSEPGLLEETATTEQNTNILQATPTVEMSEARQQ